MLASAKVLSDLSQVLTGEVMLELDQAQDGLQQSLIMVNDAVCGAVEFTPVASRSARARLGYS